MRTNGTVICFMLLTLAGCDRPAPEKSATTPVSIVGTGEQSITLRLPGMT